MKRWLAGAGIVLGGLVACSDDGEAGASAGEAGQAGSEAQAGKAAQAGDGPAGTGGEGGSAPGAAACMNGVQRLRVVSDAGVTAPGPDIFGDAPAEIASVVGFPEQQRVAINLVDSIGIFDVSSASDDGTVRFVSRLTLEDAGLPAEGVFFDLFRDGEGLIVAGARVQAQDNYVFFSWQPDEGFVELTTVPNDIGFLIAQIADAEQGIVVGTQQGLFRAQAGAADWSWEPLAAVGGRRVRPLAFDGDELLVGVDEIHDGFGGVSEGGAGGEGGQGSRPALVERWSLSGERLASHETLGNPTVAVPARGGWLVAQTNSYWGSYRAAVDWLEPAGELVRLTEVPVLSSGDGTDGAYDVALHGDDLLVANCESGLRRGAWPSDGGAVELAEVPGPWWSAESDACNPSELEVVGDVLVIAGERLDFARFCQ